MERLPHTVKERLSERRELAIDERNGSHRRRELELFSLLQSTLQPTIKVSGIAKDFVLELDGETVDSGGAEMRER
jgi:hypothetical protein